MLSRQVIDCRGHDRTAKSFLCIMVPRLGGLPRLAWRGQADPEFGLAQQIIDGRGHARTLNPFVSHGSEWWWAPKTRTAWPGDPDFGLALQMFHGRGNDGSLRHECACERQSLDQNTLAIS